MVKQKGSPPFRPRGEHPIFCDPRECLMGGEVAFKRHRSAPYAVTLPDEFRHTRFVARVTEPLLEPDVPYLEVDVYRLDEVEPSAELRFSRGDLRETINFFQELLKLGGLMEPDLIVKGRP